MRDNRDMDSTTSREPLGTDTTASGADGEHVYDTDHTMQSHAGQRVTTGDDVIESNEESVTHGVDVIDLSRDTETQGVDVIDLSRDTETQGVAVIDRSRDAETHGVAVIDHGTSDV